MLHTQNPPSSKQLPSQVDVLNVLQGIFNILDESMGPNGLSRQVEYRKPDDGSVTPDTQGQLHRRLPLMKRTLSDLEKSLLGAEKALALLPGSEFITSATSSIIRTIGSQKYDRALPPSFLVNFGRSLGRLQEALEILEKQVPSAASSTKESTSLYVGCLRTARELVENTAGNAQWLDPPKSTDPSIGSDSDTIKQLANSDSSLLRLINTLQDLIFATDRFSLSAAPYLGDRQRSMKDGYLTISAVSALFCTMPVDLLFLSQNNQDIDEALRNVIPLIIYLSTTCCTAAFMTAFIIARFIDGETSLHQKSSLAFLLRWTSYCPAIFLAMGATSFFVAFAMTLGTTGPKWMLAIIVVVLGAVVIVMLLVWRLRQVSSEKEDTLLTPRGISENDITYPLDC